MAKEYGDGEEISWAGGLCHRGLVVEECLRAIVEEYMVLTLSVSEKMISCLEECERDHAISDVRRMVSELLVLSDCCRTELFGGVSFV